MFDFVCQYAELDWLMLPVPPFVLLGVLSHPPFRIFQPSVADKFVVLPVL